MVAEMRYLPENMQKIIWRCYMRLHVLSHLDEGRFLLRYNRYAQDRDNLTGKTMNCNDDIQAHAALFLRVACGVLGRSHCTLDLKQREFIDLDSIRVHPSRLEEDIFDMIIKMCRQYRYVQWT